MNALCRFFQEFESDFSNYRGLICVYKRVKEILFLIFLSETLDGLKFVSFMKWLFVVEREYPECVCVLIVYMIMWSQSTYKWLC